MPNDPRYSRPHIRFDQFARARPYAPRPRPVLGGLRGDLDAHRARLPLEFREAISTAYESLASLKETVAGVYLKLEGQDGGVLDRALEWPSRGIRLGALRQEGEI